MGKYTTFFRENYHCKTLATSSEKTIDGKGTKVIEGSCKCEGSGRVCSWKHVVDEKGNVIHSEEHSCPCPTKSLKVTHSGSRGIQTGKAVVIGFSVLCGVLLVIGIVFLIKKHKRPHLTSVGSFN
jgi:hypothetical protein